MSILSSVKAMEKAIAAFNLNPGLDLTFVIIQAKSRALTVPVGRLLNMPSAFRVDL